MYAHAVVLLSVADQLWGVPPSLGKKRRNHTVADLGEGCGGRAPCPPLFWLKKEKPAGQVH